MRASMNGYGFGTDACTRKGGYRVVYRLSACLLSAILAFGSVPVSAFATLEEDQTEASSAEIEQAIASGEITTDTQQADDGASLNRAARAGVSTPDVRGPVTSYSGTSRIDTAAMQALSSFTKSDSAIIVGSEAWPDALSATGLAGALDCPILLTDCSSLSTETADAVSKLGVKNVVILGSQNAVSDGVKSTLEASGVACERVEGAGRYDTQRAVYAYGKRNGLWANDLVIIASGEKFADALSMSPIAYAKKAPVFLVGPDGFFTDGQQDDLLAGAEEGLFRRAVLAGDANVVSNEAVGFMRAVCRTAVGGSPTVERIAGANRYATSEAVADWAVKNGILSWDGVAFATGELPYDAIAGSAVQGRSKSVLLLSADNQYSSAAARAEANRSLIKSIRFFGAEASVPISLRLRIADALDYSYRNIAGYKVYVDAGHGYNDSNNGIFDPGAIGSGYREADVTKELAGMVATKLRAMGVDVFLNDDGGYYKYRHAEAVQNSCDRIVSIHFNSTGTGTASGSMSLRHNMNAAPGAYEFQSRVHPKLIEGMGLKDLGMRTQQVAILGGSLPAVLLEIGFIDNPSDMARYQSNKEMLATKIAEGVVQNG